MATLHAIVVYLLISLTLSSTHIILVTTTINTTSVVATTRKPNGLVAKLFYRDFVQHNPSHTIKDRAERSLNISMARFNYLSQKASQTQDTRANLQDIGNGLFVNFSIGQPPIPQLALMDTGSNLVWVNCWPCQPCIAYFEPFDPSMSSTYTDMPCGHTACDGCSVTNKCSYKVRYLSGQTTGVIATERFTFGTSDEGTTVINNVVFGCSHNNEDEDNQEPIRGIFGLSIQKPTLSIVERFGYKFSYCVGNISDPQYTSHKLILGDRIILEGDSTPIYIVDGLYYLTLKAISIGEKMLDIDPNIFQKTGVDNGVVIDSGSSLTWLATAAYKTFREEIKHRLEGLLSRYPMEPAWKLCYYGKMGEDLHGFPMMTFHFANGADLVLDIWSMFEPISPSVFCLAIGSSESNGDAHKDLSIIGILAQQNYNVAYDLVERKLFFQRIDCDLLDD